MHGTSLERLPGEAAWSPLGRGVKGNVSAGPLPSPASQCSKFNTKTANPLTLSGFSIGPLQELLQMPAPTLCVVVAGDPRNSLCAAASGKPWLRERHSLGPRPVGPEQGWCCLFRRKISISFHQKRRI